MNNPYKKKVNVSFDLTVLMNKESIDIAMETPDCELAATDPVSAMIFDAIKDGDKEKVMEIIIKEFSKEGLKTFFKEMNKQYVDTQVKSSPVKFVFKD